MNKPPIIPHRRVPVQGFEDRDNFVRDLVTLLGAGPDCSAVIGAGVNDPTPLSGSAKGDAPVVTLDQVKMHLRIDPDNLEEDAYLTSLEMAARLHTEAVLRRPLDDTVGENVKQAILLLIAHWYRNRESVGEDKLVELPLAFKALLSTERDYPVY